MILKENGKVISNNLSEMMETLNIMKSRGLSVNTERVSDAFIEECCLIIKDTNKIVSDVLEFDMINMGYIKYLDYKKLNEIAIMLYNLCNL